MITKEVIETILQNIIRNWDIDLDTNVKLSYFTVMIFNKDCGDLNDQNFLSLMSNFSDKKADQLIKNVIDYFDNN